MNRKTCRERSRRAFFLVLAVALLVAAIVPSQATTQAQSGGSYDLTWHTIDGGGATFSTGGTYSLGGTIGQADAGTLSGGTYTLNGGFWGGALNLFYQYLPVILKNQ